MMIKSLIVIILLIVISGCTSSPKRSETIGIIGGVASSTVSGIWKIFPGYKTRRIKWLEFKVEEAQLQQRRDEIRVERKMERLKYKKLSLGNEKKKVENKKKEK